jgi:hypothetical protein
MADSDDGIAKFLLPEKDLSLKLVFDNVRNYAIVGAIFVAAQWSFGRQISGPPVLTHGASDGTVISFIFLAVGLILAAMNACQTFLLVRRLTGLDRTGDSVFKVAGWPWYAKVATFILAMFMSLLTVAAFFAIGGFVVYFAWFPVSNMH